MTQSERFKGILDYFKHHQPDAATELNYNSPYELLVAVILSAQCTDKRVNLTVPAFFDKYPDAVSLSNAAVEDIFPLIKSISYPNNKSKHLSGMAKMLMNEFDGEVPADVGLLQRLPGVGRKTANVIASCIFNQPKMAVDTHVFRVAARLGLTRGAKNPLQAELQLIKHIPEEQISLAHHWLILHGRYVCLARNPKCSACAIRSYCKYFEKMEKKKFFRTQEPGTRNQDVGRRT
ncbi:MAG: endonuclease III [Chitinophagaceae bacterium]|nr:endonuclease III [Chitinophagaceae bacterium]